MNRDSQDMFGVGTDSQDETKREGGAIQDTPKGVMSDSKFMTAAEKTAVVEDMRRLVSLIVKEGVPSDAPKAFTVRLYEHLHLHCGHIAHYDRNGFWRAQFGTSKRALSFFEELLRRLRGRCWGIQDYQDVNGALRELVGQKLQALHVVLEPGVRSEAMLQIKLLAAEAGIALDELGMKEREVQTESTAVQEALF